MASSSSSKKRRKTKIDRTADENDPSANREDAVDPSAVVDLISSLPDGVMASIISLLPLKEAMRTSILASRWRHLWTHASIDIDVDVDDRRSSKTMRSRLDAVTGILSCHRGPIRSFRLSDSLWEHLLVSRRNHDLFCVPYRNWRRFDGKLNPWLQTLTERGIQDLTLHYKLPPQLLTCQSLRSLKLMELQHGEILALPPNLKELKLGRSTRSEGVGIRYQTELPPALVACQSLCSLKLSWFDLMEPYEMMPLPPNLRKLKLLYARLTDGCLAHILSRCRFLECLCLNYCQVSDRLHIRSQSLRKITVRPRASYLKIVDAPNLEIFCSNHAHRVCKCETCQ